MNQYTPHDSYRVVTDSLRAEIDQLKTELSRTQWERDYLADALSDVLGRVGLSVRLNALFDPSHIAAILASRDDAKSGR